MSDQSDLHFSDNYRDLCQQTGTGAGFQFEFYCQCCNDTWRSPFEPYRSGQASGWMREAGGLLSGLLGNFGNQIDNAADGLAVLAGARRAIAPSRRRSARQKNIFIAAHIAIATRVIAAGMTTPAYARVVRRILLPKCRWRVMSAPFKRQRTTRVRQVRTLAPRSM